MSESISKRLALRVVCRTWYSKTFSLLVKKNPFLQSKWFKLGFDTCLSSVINVPLLDEREIGNCFNQILDVQRSYSKGMLSAMNEIFNIPLLVDLLQTGNDEYKPAETTVEITVDIATGIEEILETSTLIYPNPVVSEMVIKFSSSEERTIRIFDLQGRLKLQKETSSTSERFNLSNFKSGMYLMRVQAKSESFTYKIIKK